MSSPPLQQSTVGSPTAVYEPPGLLEIRRLEHHRRLQAERRKNPHYDQYTGAVWPRPPGQIGAPSLFQCATASLLRHINRIDDFGGLDAAHFRHIVRKVPNAVLLEKWEKAHPDVRGENGNLWMKFIRQDGLHKNPEERAPKDPKDWPKVWHQLQREKEIEDQKAVEQLKARLAAERAAHDARIPEIKAAPLSRHNGSILTKLALPRGGVTDRSKKILLSARPTTMVGRDSMKKRVRDDPLDMEARKAAKRKREEALAQAERDRNGGSFGSGAGTVGSSSSSSGPSSSGLGTSSTPRTESPVPTGPLYKRPRPENPPIIPVKRAAMPKPFWKRAR